MTLIVKNSDGVIEAITIEPHKRVLISNKRMITLDSPCRFDNGYFVYWEDGEWNKYSLDNIDEILVDGVTVFKGGE